MQKKLYFGGCSFLEKPNVFEKPALIDYFGKDSIIINNAKGGSSNDQIFRKALISILKNDFDFVLIGWTQVWRSDKVIDVYDENVEYGETISAESYKDILDTSHYYSQNIPNDSKGNKRCHLEPQGTDNHILYVLALQQILKQKNIPYLFLTMGTAIKETLKNRRGWLELIDEKNYFGEGDIFDKMSFSVVDDFYKKHIELFGNDIEYLSKTYVNPIGYIRDNASHLSERGGEILAEQIKEYIISNNII